MKKFILALAVLATVVGSAHAIAIGARGGQKAMTRSIDANGQPIAFNADKPWNVFELAYSAAVTQVVDNKGNAPKVGIVGRVCLESAATSALAATEWAKVYDASTIAATSVTGSLLAPALMRVSGVATCTDLNAQFTSGLVLQNLDAAGATYVYWK